MMFRRSPIASVHRNPADAYRLIDWAPPTVLDRSQRPRRKELGKKDIEGKRILEVKTYLSVCATLASTLAYVRFRRSEEMND
jgi:hypothetical protein